ncbi:hypothetical protein INT45_001382 [Circinella minor]|uniref:Uncharacterized protein n=1 Tax=Circinella minor TaxID=1195481 RepID=A0A8H7VDH6_9FUNG|nr:hypothetical protein INT45_001382 [Circinella minor]
MAKTKKTTERKRQAIPRKSLKKAGPTAAELRAASTRLKSLIGSVQLLQETHGQQEEHELARRLNDLSLEETQTQDKAIKISMQKQSALQNDLDAFSSNICSPTLVVKPPLKITKYRTIPFSCIKIFGTPVVPVEKLLKE